MYITSEARMEKERRTGQRRRDRYKGQMDGLNWTGEERTVRKAAKEKTEAQKGEIDSGSRGITDDSVWVMTHSGSFSD